MTEPSITRRRRACEDGSPVLLLPTGHVDSLNPNGGFSEPERRLPWSQPIGFAPEGGRRTYAQRRLVAVAGYRPRGPR